MILQSLYQYYQRLLDDPESHVAKPGYSKAKVSFALNISKDGELLNLIDLRKQEGKKLISPEIDVPVQGKRTSGMSSNYLSDNPKYVLGIEFDKKTKGAKIAKEHFLHFKKYNLNIIGNSEDEGLQAICKFLNRWKPEESLNHPLINNRMEDLASASNLVFRLHPEYQNIHERNAAVELWQSHQSNPSTGNEILSQCLITGEKKVIARLHPDFKGIPGAQTSGASLVSFNQDSFESYGKSQSYNSPVSEDAAFAYGTALRHLLRFGSKQRIRIGDTTTVFWAERKTPAEDMLLELLSPEVNDDDINVVRDSDSKPINDSGVSKKIYTILDRVRQGLHLKDISPDWDPDIRFYILGLSPNAGRISVRFWHVNTLGTLITRIGQHYQDLVIQKQYDSQPDFIPVWIILKELAVQGKSENVPPLINGALIRSILEGMSYPQGLYTAILTRIHADQKINYVRTSVIKACLIRQARINGITIKEATMALNEGSTNVPYRLGRLFAWLEKAQEDANPGINSTIRDRYFGAASATPRSVFPILIRLAQHHIAKSDYGFSVNNRIKEVVNEIDQFPAHLNLEDQGLFILGYYHQRNAIFTKKDKNEKE
ncbi:MAG: type I-C CRISPR-associated protein Cas8c/Csd1 [bacterium]